MPIKTLDVLPGEKGYVSKKEKTLAKKLKEKKIKLAKRKKETTIGKIKIGAKGYRIGQQIITHKQEKKYPIWRYSKKIGKIVIKNKEAPNTKESTEQYPQEEITLKFKRLGSIGNYRHLIQDADFQMQWMIREQELLMTQDTCHNCDKKISKTAKPNLYHYNMFKKQTELLEKASQVPQEVIDGKLTIEQGWEKFNQILEEGNQYYMSLKDTALICPSCAKQKGLIN